MSSPLLLSAIWVVPLLAAFATLFLKRDDHLAVKLVHAAIQGFQALPVLLEQFFDIHVSLPS